MFFKIYILKSLYLYHYIKTNNNYKFFIIIQLNFHFFVALILKNIYLENYHL